MDEETHKSDRRNMTSNRRITKPIMEKKRRARINASLAELKTLLTDLPHTDALRNNRMEKTDILEMTVRHLKDMQQHHSMASEKRLCMNKYITGFNECAHEVSRYLANTDHVTNELRSRLQQHLSSVITNRANPVLTSDLTVRKQLHNFEVNNNSNAAKSAYAEQAAGVPVVVRSPPGETSGLNILSGVTLTPVRLSNGDVAFIFPQSCSTNFTDGRCSITDDCTEVTSSRDEDVESLIHDEEEVLDLSIHKELTVSSTTTPGNSSLEAGTVPSCRNVTSQNPGTLCNPTGHRQPPVSDNEQDAEFVWRPF